MNGTSWANMNASCFSSILREYFVMSEPKWPPGSDESQLGCTAVIGPIWLQDRYQSLRGRTVHFQPGWLAAAYMSFVSETLERKLLCGCRLASVTAPIRADVPRGENNGWKRRVFFTAVIPTAIHHKDKIPFPALVKTERVKTDALSGAAVALICRFCWDRRCVKLPSDSRETRPHSHNNKRAVMTHQTKPNNLHRQQCYIISCVFS